MADDLTGAPAEDRSQSQREADPDCERCDGSNPDDVMAASCPNCGPTATEPHPRLPVERCRNCKQHLATEDGRPIDKLYGE